MVGKTKETAEQKLLKMIESSGGGALLASKQEQKIKTKQNLLSIMKLVNMVLIGLIIVGVCLVVYQVKSGVDSAVTKFKFEVPPLAKETAQVALPALTSVDVYLKNIRYRNLFTPYEKPIATVSSEVGDNREIVKMTKTLRLVGVAWLDSVESASAMIEDLDKKITFFLMKGEKIGEVFVKTIYADSVELGYKNEEIILKYDKVE